MRMKWSVLPILALGLGGLWFLADQRPTDPEETKISERSWNLHRGHDMHSFLRLPEAEGEIDFGNVDLDLLDAAVFHETNRRRMEYQLKPLQYLPRLRIAARTQAEHMKQEGRVSHDHADPELRTPADRVRRAGLRPAFVAENVASVFGQRYESGTPYHKRREGDRWIISTKPGGPPIPPHTYASFAAMLLDGWMESPGHKENIVHPRARSLGVACLHQPGDGGLDTFYCAQAFFAPFF